MGFPKGLVLGAMVAFAIIVFGWPILSALLRFTATIGK